MDHLDVRKVAKSKSRKLQGKVEKCKSIIPEIENVIQNTFTRMINLLSGREIEKVDVWKLRDIEKLYNLEEEAEISDKDIMELDTQKEVAEKEDVEEISSTQE